MKTEKEFTDWLYMFKFFHGTCRYHQFPGAHVFVAVPVFDEELRELVDDLEGGDHEALRAAEELQRLHDSDEIIMAYSDYPHVAVEEIYKKLRKYYFDVLNAEATE
jgi:hypothetical protein